jgi:1-aminocyclopropane-1-carboxylate deaminase/D-cysteine desulfhydrase-like pyridoxal-dependent ACC family enzyme
MLRGDKKACALGANRENRRLMLGTYPTPVQRITIEGAELWVKRDDLTHPVYGGNKVRKLEHILEDARARGAKRLVTVGAVGSHHVLATTYFGTRAGLRIEAVMVPQPRTAHVVEDIRAGLALGLRVAPVTSWWSVPFEVLRRLGHDAYFVSVGGSSTLGAMGYVDAARELAAQVRAGEMPEPDVAVVALGSGGTVAGIAAGLEAEGMKTRVVAIDVADPPFVIEWSALLLARACARRAGVQATLRTMRSRIEFDRRFRGAGYGHATAQGEDATRAAGPRGITLDPTYTAKAFAAALARARDATSSRTILYWHTLSSAPMGPLLAGAPAESELAPGVRALLSD